MQGFGAKSPIFGTCTYYKSGGMGVILTEGGEVCVSAADVGRPPEAPRSPCDGTDPGEALRVHRP